LARPGWRKLHNLASGVGPFSFSGQLRRHLHNRQNRSHALIGQERSKENAALAVEPGCGLGCSGTTAMVLQLSAAVSGSYNQREALAGAPQNSGVLGCGSFDNPKSQLGSFPLELCDL